MDRDRRALVAFALLAALVVMPIALTTSGVHHLRQTAAGRPSGGPARTADVNKVVQPAGSHTVVGHQEAASGPVLSLPAGCGPAAPAIFPGARPAHSLGNEAAILRQLNGLGRTTRLTDLATLTMGRAGWLADSQTGLDVFRWYDRRLRAVPIWKMGQTLRALIGMRPRGLVDSPAILYVNSRAAVLIRQIGADRMGLLVAASCSGTQAA